MDGSDTRNLIGLAGDWHGNFKWTRYALHTFGQAGLKKVFHAGDFGFGWPGKWPDYANICESICKRYGMRLYVTPGNHENWEWINTRADWDDDLHWVTPHVALMRRNCRMDLYYETGDGNAAVRSLVSLGGAPSIDFDGRRERIDWWPEEMITRADLERLEADGHADVMVCHDSPAWPNATPKVKRIHDIPVQASFFSAAGVRYAREGTRIMDIAYEAVRPKVFVHGHMHVADVNRTDPDEQILSLNCDGENGNLAVLDLRTLAFDFIDLLNELPPEPVKPDTRLLEEQ